MRKITPCLWFDDQAQPAAEFYVSVFENSRILHIGYYGEPGPRPAGMVMEVRFEIGGQEFLALNGGPEFTLSPAVSFMANCETQDEIDRVWEQLSEGGEKSVCGWLQDKFGVSWQVVPAMLAEWMSTADQAQADRVMAALLPMTKLDIATLQEAYEGER